MQALDLLERLGELPAEIWLVPPVLILAAIIAIGLVLRRFQLRRYHAIAARTGLIVKPKIVNASEVHGTFRGRALVMTVCSPQRTRFTLRKQWTRVTVDVTNPEHIGLRLRRQDMFDTLIMRVGGGDVQVGDAEFDRRFVIQSRDDERMVARIFQSRELRDLLVRAEIDSVELFGAPLRAYYARNERDPDHAELFFTAVTSLADAVDALRAEHSSEIIRGE